MKNKTSVADLNPEVVSDDAHVTVTFKTPPDMSGAMKVKVENSRIKLDFKRRQTREVTDTDGNVTSSAFLQRQRRMMAVPKGADQTRYKVSAADGAVSVVFARTASTSTEASK
jgi:HSP20 family molecular chaperone IbpA